ncbi:MULTISPECIES: plasmid replication protein [Dickeya]|uniref:plasmid replication protein n=1 Tax=Dickeya TaxID=204037 RepID=UPI00035DEB83|nr:MULTISPECIES: plasmid replication protein [Dickeya]AUQ25110.1 plasmid replication protein [Dickeya zeae]PLY35761.1 plasmid replication protein [Pectobacterium carotovorum]UJR55065.1 plasmid replication protein [Dickeya zeae MS1]UJR58193.1 plasmid replication protein [Dickeya zeae]
MIVNGKKIKAKDLAKMAGVSRSTVIKYYGITRDEYEKEAAEKRSLAFQLRSSGLKWKEVAEEMNTTQNSAIAYYRRYIKSNHTL